MSLKFFTIVTVLFFALIPTGTVPIKTAADKKLQNVRIIDVPGRETGFILNYNDKTKEFTKYYFFQYDRKKGIIDAALQNQFKFVSADKSKLVLRLDDETFYVFSMDEKYTAKKREVVIYGYALAEYNSGKKPFKLLDKKNITQINDLIGK